MNEFKAESTPRRGFLARLAAGSLAFVAGGQATAHANLSPHASAPVEKAEPWLMRIKGKHRQIFDAMEINSGFPLVMTHIWLMTNKSAYNLSPKELSAVLVLRHSAIAICMGDAVWAKYITTAADGKAFAAATWGSLIVACGSFVTVQYVANKWMILPAIVGGFIGTYLMMKYGRHK